MFKYGRVLREAEYLSYLYASIVLLCNSKATSVAVRRDRARRMSELLRFSISLAVA